MGDVHVLNEPATEDQPRRVLIADDQRTLVDLLELAIKSFDDFECVGVAVSTAEAVTLAARERPDLVIMDVHFAGEVGDGITATAEIRRVSPGSRVVLLTGHADQSTLRRAAEAGACSLMPKDGSLPDLVQALRTAGDNRLVVHPTLLRTLIRESPSVPAQTVRLSAREVDVLGMLALGLDAKSISTQLGISLNTCRGYVKTLLSKLHAHSQLEAVAVARRLGLLDVEASAPR
jgi:two-component system nitrate/nitrite response regulator NarL